MSEKKSRLDAFRALATKDIKFNLSKQDKKRLIILVIELVVLTSFTFILYRIYINLRGVWPTRILNMSYYILSLSVAMLGMKLTGMDIKASFRFKGVKQYIFGVASGLFLLFVIAVVPSFFGASLIGLHYNYSIETYIFQFFYYFIFVGPVEEFIFRVYVQETLTDILPKAKWLAPIISAVIFGLRHTICGTWYQACFATGIGIFWGLCKHFSKNCTYISTWISHGLYDFGLLLAIQFIVK